MRGNLSKVTYPDNTFEQYSCDAEGRRTNSMDRAGRSTSFIFDALGRLTQTICPDNTSTRTIYDPAGRVQFTVDARGVTNAFGNDAAGRRIAVTNAWGTSVAQWTTNAYDVGGNMIAASDALARVTDFSYNAANQQVQVMYPTIVTGQSRPFTLTGYDSEGRRVVETNEANVVTGFRYDNGLGALLSVTNAQGTADKTVTSYSYDPLGRQTNQVDAMGRRTAFEFDADGRRLRRLLPGTQSEGFAYDAVGNLLRQTNFNGQIITNLRDSHSRLLSRWHGSTQLVAYTYNLTGQRATMSNETGVTTFVYDTRDRLTTNASPVGTLIYTYDENGNLTNLVSSTAGGVSIGYQYDALNRLTNVIDNRLTGTKNTAYTFDAVGNLTALKYPNGVTNLWQHDARNRLTNVVWKLNGTTHGSFAYQLGASGSRTNLSETLNGNSRTFSWSFDSLYRLTNETIGGTAPSGAISYKLDAVGNRTNRTSGVTGILTTNNYFDANDWLDIDSTTNNGSAWFDMNGNTRTNLGGTVTTLLYDWANRLTNANNGGVIVAYDADGNRVKKTVGGTTTFYLVSTVDPSGYAQVVEELTVSGGVTNLSKVYTYGLDLISQRTPSSSTNFFGTDGLGSTRLLLDMAGSAVNAFSYDAFGTLIASNAAPQTAYLFAGEQFDPDLGLYYNRARYLDPASARFISMDSYEGAIRDPQSLHKYTYGQANPVMFVDPSGRNYTYSGITVSTAIIGSLATLSFSPGIANAPAPGDPTYSSDGSAALAGNIVGGVVIGNLVKYAVGPAVAKLWNFFKPAKKAKLIKARYANPDEFSGTGVGARVEVKPGMPEGEYLFVVDQNGKMWVVPRTSGLHHNSLVPADEGVLAAGNLKVEAGGKVSAHGGSGHYNLKGPDGAFGSGEVKAFEDGVGELLKSLGFEVKGVSHTQFFPGEVNPFE